MFDKTVKKAIKIVVALAMIVASGTALQKTVSAEENNDTLYFGENKALIADPYTITDRNQYNNKTKPSFAENKENEGSDMSEGSNEGEVWTNKIINTTDTVGEYEITFQAIGFMYREVGRNNIKTDEWKNPLDTGDDSIFTMSEDIAENFHYVDDSFSFTNISDEDGNTTNYIDEDEYEFSSIDNKVEFSFKAKDVKPNVNKRIAFDFEVTFKVMLDETVGIGTYNTNPLDCSFKPAMDNYYYYVWGTHVTTEKYAFYGYKWNSGGGNDGKGFIQLQKLKNVTLPGSQGKTNQIIFSLNSTGEDNDMENVIKVTDKNQIKVDDNNDYPLDTPEKLENYNYWINVGDLYDNQIRNDKLKNHGIEKIYMYLRRGANDFNFRIEILYTDGTWKFYTPTTPFPSQGGNQSKDTENNEYELIETVVIEKGDPEKRDESFFVDKDHINKTYDNIGTITLNIRNIDEIIQYDKVAVNKKWNERTYDVTITASSLLEQAEENHIDVVLAIDTSGSMLFPSKLSVINDSSYNPSQLEEIFNGDNNNVGVDVNKSQEYYVINQPAGKATVYRIKYTTEKVTVGYKDDDKKNPIRVDNCWIIYDSSQGEKYNENMVNDEIVAKKVTADNIKSLFGCNGNDTYPIYTAEDDTHRLDYIQNAANKFIDKLANISSQSNVGIVSFNKNATIETKELLTLTDNNVSFLQNKINDMTLAGGTNQPDALTQAKNLLDKSDTKNEKFVILLTDGSVNAKMDNGTLYTNESMKAPAKEIENQGYHLITLGVSMADIKEASKILQEIASKWTSGNKLHYALSYETDYPEELDAIFNQIISSVMGSSLTEVTIKDYIDPRFDLMNGDTKAADGDVINGGTVGIDDKGIMYIEWENQTIGNAIGEEPGWQKTITLKAKEDFLGGNVITTNGSESSIKIPFGTKDPDKKEEVVVELPQPTVNVKELEGDSTIAHKKYFLGEDIDYNVIENEILNYLKENKLNEIQGYITQLIQEGKTSIPYFYGINNDIVGNLSLTIEKNKDKITTGVTNKEVYTLVLKYTPLSQSERQSNNKIEDQNMPKDPNKIANEFNLFTGVGRVTVYEGSIKIRKSINEFTHVDSQGDPIFTYHISGKTVSGDEVNEYRSIRFETDPGDQSQFVAKINHLEKGIYTITELDSIRYSLGNITVQDNKNNDMHKIFKTDNSAVVFIGCSESDFEHSLPENNQEFDINDVNAKVLNADDIKKLTTKLSYQDIIITFANNKINDNDQSDTDIVINTFKKNPNGSISISGKHDHFEEAGE